ncbi:hypothetical protein QBC46DRAFT_422900 [Diplogelasinospora grovesii]|uniref:F-box domain-containing protein n=1 Tax=Diplogelasinospora grovesii TaxID=303347 RepID=A0AAN6MZA1_9PEZI|nr:hypothetical protein QBC46DRAFT_422900 [Diplogelasinospora grovesii]
MESLLSSSDLHALCLVNKALRTLAEPFLYSKIQWTWAREESPPPITLLLRSISRRPQLAAYIRIAIFEGKRYGMIFYKTAKLPVSIAELDELVAFVRNIKLPCRDFWIKELRSGTVDAFVALLLSRLSNLTFLRLEPNFWQESRFIGLMLRSALCAESADYELPKFEHLRAVYVDEFFDASHESRVNQRRGPPFVTNTADVLPFFYLSTVKSISASIDNPVTFAWPAAHPPAASRLVSLDLTRIREAHLGQLLEVTPKLETLRWGWYYDSTLKTREPCNTGIIDLDQNGAAISYVRSTLTDLTIIAGYCMYDRVTSKGSLRALVQCDKLKSLEAPWPFLMGWLPEGAMQLKDVMPRNIEFLTITDDMSLEDDYKWHDDDAKLQKIQSWLENWRTHTPHLRCVALGIRDSSDYGWDEIRDEFKELSARVGMRIEVIELDYSRPVWGP